MFHTWTIYTCGSYCHMSSENNKRPKSRTIQKRYQEGPSLRYHFIFQLPVGPEQQLNRTSPAPPTKPAHFSPIAIVFSSI